MKRSILALLIGMAAAGRASDHNGVADPAFDKIPFERWLGERDQMKIRWSASAGKPELSFHQRLMVRIGVKVDGRDLQTRREGRLVYFVQISDTEGLRYQDHGSIELEKLDQNIKAADLEYVQRAFMLPGDYKLAVAILDTATGEHAASQSQFKVSMPQRETLADAWSGLPPVEFIPTEEPPEGWYNPGVTGRLHWPVSLKSPARLNVILNVAVSAPVPGSRRSHGNDLEALLPTLKVMARGKSDFLTRHIELVDLSRKRTVFKLDGGRDLDWDRLKGSLGEANTASIDVHSLEERHRDAQFFVSRVRAAMKASEGPCVLAVLTPSVAFESGEDLEPIALEGLPACRVVYIRYRQAPPRMARPFEPPMARQRRDPRIGIARDPALHQVVDQLAGTLKPLSPKVIDVETPDQMARALQEVEKALTSQSK